MRSAPCPALAAADVRQAADKVDARLDVELTEERRFGNGVVVLRYAVRG